MACDVLRSFHSVDAWFDENRTIKAKIRWYPCKQGAKPLPVPSAFGSPVWEPNPDDWTVGPGVESGPLIWRRTRYPAPRGDHYHGEGENFLKGITSDQLASVEEDAVAVNECFGLNAPVLTFAFPSAVAFVNETVEVQVSTVPAPQTDEVDILA